MNQVMLEANTHQVNSNSISSVVARKTRAAMESRGLSLNKLAERTGVSHRTLKRITQADFTGYNPTISTVQALATGLRIKLSKFIDRK